MWIAAAGTRDARGGPTDTFCYTELRREKT